MCYAGTVSLEAEDTTLTLKMNSGLPKLLLTGSWKMNLDAF